MKTIEEAAKEYGRKVSPQSDWTARNAEISFKAGAEFAQRWIPVEEEFPEVKQYDYQVLAKSIYGYELLDIDTDSDVEGTISLNYITHWMYLPEPPKHTEKL